uniref:Alfy-like armadillo-like repeat domain-containing protein n=1 Tax=Xiphophorus couchianus TaxID=32473 RepID=A0A3B5LV97_9TELE
MFLQIFLQLSKYPHNVEQLVETEELQCLIIGLTSLCDQTSPQWRHQASCVLKAVSSVPTNKTVPISGSLLAEVAVAVFSFVRDTYHLNPALFTEFDTNNGYKALKNILKRLSHQSKRCISVQSEIYIISLKKPETYLQSLAVKNLPAFHLLQASLLRSQDSHFCCQLLRTLQTIWEKDPANFFLLEWTVQSMAQLATRVCRKPLPVQKIFFSMLEMNEVILGKVFYFSLLLSLYRYSKSRLFLLFCRMIVHSTMLTEVLCDWGLLELLLGELRRRAKILRKAGNVSNVIFIHNMFSMCFLVSLRDLGMVPYIKIFLDDDQYRGPTLSILEQLAEINPDEFMSTAVGALCSSTQQELRLKLDLLQSVLRVLENPNTWDAFRKAGGFSGLLSLMVDMEGALSDPPNGDVWKTLGHQQLLELLLLILHIMALAVHLHIVNAHHFQTEGFYERLSDALLQLGCFHTEGQKWEGEKCSCPQTSDESQTSSFFQFVELAEALAAPKSCSGSPQQNLPIALQMCIRLLSYLDQFATGTYSPQALKLGQESDGDCDENSKTLHGPEGHEGVNSGPPSVLKFTCDQVILHPGAVTVIMTLLPHVFAPEDPQLSMEVQCSLAHHILSMVKSERNRQIMCEGGLVSTLLTHCRSILLSPNHHLHLPVTRIFEKLSSQAISFLYLHPLRQFLCLGDPLMCLADETSKQMGSSKTIFLACLSELLQTSGPSLNFLFFKPDENTDAESSRKTLKRSFSLLQPSTSFGSAIPVHQIVSLVSMTAPRTFRPHRVSSSPAFVEFDMSESGYGCLFLPSVATVKGVTSDSIATGGIGGECRGFPPTSGLSFTCWFQINRFSSACDSHPIRLLTVVRHMSRTEQQYICLSISFSAYDGCLVISTEEEAFTYLDMMEPEVCSPTSLTSSLRFRCSSMLVPGQWHHLAVVMAKDVKKSCLTSAYFNGKAVGTGKMKYIQPFPGQFVSMDPTAVIDVYGLIGTPAMWKDHAALVWRVGPCHLFEEVLSSETVAVVYTQGTAYLGNFLALRNMGESSSLLRLVYEERVSFGINPAVSTLTNVVQIREDYNEVDCRLIAKEMGITSRDHSTPVFFLQNISKHLSGTARTIGAAMVGRFGVRTFIPKSASTGFLYVGGPAVVLSLVAMAADDGSLYAAIKVVLSVLETNSAMQAEMNRINGYKLLAFLLKMKSSLISHRTFQLALCLSSSVEMSCGTGYLQNTPAFQALLCDLEVWRDTPDSLDLSVLKHFADILKSSSSDSRNAVVMHSVGLLPKLLFDFCDPAVTLQRVHIISDIITLLLKAHMTSSDISSHIMAGILIQINLFFLSPSHQATVFQSLGSDWFLLFLQAHLHPSTLKLGLILLTQFLSNPGQQSSFREGVMPGTLIEGIEEPFVIMDNLRVHSWSQECLSTTCPGFDVLQELLVRHTHVPQVYEALAALLLGRSTSHMTARELDLDDALQELIESQREAPSQQLCVEAAMTLLELVKVIISQPLSTDESDSEAPWEVQLPSSVMQFLCLLHNLRPRDPLWASPKFLRSLASVVYPVEISEVNPCKINKREGTFSTHPTRKPVLDFMRILLMDSLLNVCSSSNTHPTVLLLEVNFQPCHQQTFQSELVDHEDDNNTHLTSQGNITLHYFFTPKSVLNRNEIIILFFLLTMLQKLHSGTFAGDPESLLDFLADQIMVVRRRQTAFTKFIR